MLISYNWLCDYLGDQTPTPERIVALLTQHAFEIEGFEVVGNDTVIDVDVLPNRSSDCLSHRGIAREIAAIIDVSLAWDPLATTPVLPDTTSIQVDVADSQACPRFTACLLQGITVGESPQWMQERLRALGQRPINTIVDVTNYVMYSLGQPLHAYDAEKFPRKEGVWHFGVQKARPDETISLLAEGGGEADRVIALNGEELLITEGTTDTPIGLAGVKGGTFAGVNEATTSIILEAAHFDPVRTRETARRHKIVIDASKRFENEPSPELPLYAQAEALRLLQEMGAVRCGGIVDVYEERKTTTTVAVDPIQVNSLLGTNLTVGDMASILRRVGCSVEEQADNTLQVIGPWERTDLNLSEDMIEEIGRLHGYHQVAPILPKAAPVHEYSALQYYSEEIRRTLLAQGYSEVITSSFRKKDQVKLHNALASDKAFLRSSLAKSVHETLDKNIHHLDLLGLSDIRVFEIGTVFQKAEHGVEEHIALALGVRVRPAGYSGKEDAIVQEALVALESVLGDQVAWRQEKGVAETNVSKLLNSLPSPTAYQPVLEVPTAVYQPFSNYPAVSRDIALWVPSSTASDVVEELLNQHAGDLRQRTTLFDEFHKDGRISYAFRLVFQSYDKTLTDTEVNACMEEVYRAVAKEEWEVR